MPILTLTNLEKTFGPRTLFNGLNFLIDRGERVGLIGDNGSGKTSLFKAITGELAMDAGSIAIARTIKLGHLTQDAQFDPKNNVLDEAELAFAELHSLAHQLRDLEHAMADHQGEELEDTLEKYQKIQHDFELAGGYAWKHKLEATLLGVGLSPESWEQNVETLSGGQRSRLNLAKILIAQPDLLLLDEPTNHLDLAAIEWLENYLLAFDGAVLLISHDRFLLDKLCTRIAWLTQAKIKSYPGNYSAFQQQKAVEELTQQRAFEEQQADIEKQKEFIRRFNAGQRAREAKGREKRLNRLLKSDAVIDQVAVSKKIHLSIDTDQRAGDRVLEARNLSKGFDSKPLWKDVKFEVKRGERIGIIGPNGSGKTTLLRTLLGDTDADSGDIKWGANLNIGYYDQRLDDFDPENNIFEEVGEGRVIKDQEIRNILALMLFRGDDIYKQMSLLSGGERARVALAELLLDKPNVLLLDEPTNHLDVNSCEALENAMRDFPGTILCVSHDRYFLNRVTKRLLVIQPPDVTDFEGNYESWVRKLAEKERERKAAQERKTAQKQPAKPQVAKPAPKANADNPYKRPFGRLTIEELEKKIAETEKEITQVQSDFADPQVARDPGLYKKMQDQYSQLRETLEQLEAEYFARETE
jgi:ATP-binding cassette subfamily F protein 3